MESDLDNWVKHLAKLEKHYSKEEILHMYINTVDFGGNHFGLKISLHCFVGMNYLQPN